MRFATSHKVSGDFGRWKSVNSLKECEEIQSRPVRPKARAQIGGIGRILGEESGPRGTKVAGARLRAHRMCLAAEHLSDEDLELYVRERLDASKAARMSFHLESCAECRDRLAQTVIYLLDLRQHMKKENDE